MEMKLKINCESIFLENRIIFKKIGNKYKFNYNEEFLFEDKSTFLLKFLGKKRFSISNSKKCIGLLKMRGLGNMVICINHSGKSLFFNIILIEYLFNIKKTFYVNSILYQYRKNELMMNSSYKVDDIGLLIGCLILYFSSKIGNVDMPLDIDE